MKITKKDDQPEGFRKENARQHPYAPPSSRYTRKLEGESKVSDVAAETFFKTEDHLSSDTPLSLESLEPLTAKIQIKLGPPNNEGNYTLSISPQSIKTDEKPPIDVEKLSTSVAEISLQEPPAPYARVF